MHRAGELRRPDGEAVANHVFLDDTAKSISRVIRRDLELGNVRLMQGQNTVSGQRLVINLDNGRAVIDGGPPGVNSSGGRVTGHFTVPQRQQR